jgi:very-short-patch-repair endonuclease
MDTTSRRVLLERAASQHGVFTTAQAVEAGVTSKQLAALERSQVVGRLARGVWRVTGSPGGPSASASAVVLSQGPGAFLARSSAAWLWDVPGHRSEPVEVLHRRDVHRPATATTHTSRALGPDDVTTRDGIPVTTPTRTLFDLAGGQHPLRTRQDLNNLMGRGLVTVPLLEEALDRLAQRGRPGITVMRRLIEEAADKSVAVGSNLELLVEEILETAGYRHMARQVPACDGQGFIARVDFADRARRIAVEVDSERFHHGLVDRQLDDAKTSRLEAAGWTVVRIPEHEVWHDRAALVTRLRKLRCAHPAQVA